MSVLEAELSMIQRKQRASAGKMIPAEAFFAQAMNRDEGQALIDFAELQA